MTTFFITDANTAGLLDALAAQGPVLKSTPDSEGGFARYQPHREGEPLKPAGIRTSSPLKELLFPPRERVCRYPSATAEAPEPPAPPAVVGVAACDLHALASLDAVFLAEDFVDGFYAERRKRLFIVTQDCTDPRPTCACTYLGIKPYAEEGFDLNLSPVSGGWLVEAGSDRGREFLSAHRELLSDAAEAMTQERDERRRAAVEVVEKTNAPFELRATRQELLLGEDPTGAWISEVSTCVECAACLFACPTCHCFLLYDRKADGTNERFKAWDACSYAGYAKMAGGGTPRALLLERFRHRYMHKFDYFVENHGFEMCTGCGRCIEGCAGKIDMRRLFKALESTAAPAAP